MRNLKRFYSIVCKVALILGTLIPLMLGTGCTAAYVYTVGQAGNYEPKSTDYKIKPPIGYRTTLKNLEANFDEEWTAFDRDTEGYAVYYGWLRGNVRGQFKFKIREDTNNNVVEIEYISLNRHGIGGMGISGYKTSAQLNKDGLGKNNWYTLPLDIKNALVAPKITYFETAKDKEAFISNDSLSIPLNGGDIWGPFTVKVKGKVLKGGKKMVGTWHCNHGFFGDYRGTLYGIRLGQKKIASASILDEDLYQLLLDFNPKNN